MFEQMSLFSEEDLDLFSSVASFFTAAGIYDSLETQILSHLSKPEFRFNSTQFATQRRIAATQNATQQRPSTVTNATQGQRYGDFARDEPAFAITAPTTPTKTTNDFQLMILDAVVDPLHLMSHSPRLANFAFSQPRRLERLFARVISASLGSRIASPRKFSEEEICVRFSIPFLPDLLAPLSTERKKTPKGALGHRDSSRRNIFRVYRVTEAIESAATGLFQLRGTIVALTTPVKYVMAAKFVCEQDKCLYASSGLAVWEVLRPGDAELNPQSPFKSCFGCGKRMAEDATRRCIGEKIDVTILPCENVVGSRAVGEEARWNSSFRQGIRIVVRDSFCRYDSNEVFLGQIVDVVGFAGKNVRIWRDVGAHVEAISILSTPKIPLKRNADPLDDTLSLSQTRYEERNGGMRHQQRQQQYHRRVPSLSSDFDESQFSLFSNDPFVDDKDSSSVPPGFARLPDSILALLTSSSASPWRFTWTLAYSVGTDVTPRESFHRLKLTLLLALVMVRWDDERTMEEEEEQFSPHLSLDVLVCGTETEFIDRITTYFGKLLPEKYVRHSVLSTPIVRKTTVVSDGSPSTCLEAGSLYAARDGICHLGFIPRIKKSELHLVKHSLDSRRRELPSSSTFSSSALNERRPNCFLWGFCDPIRSKAYSSKSSAGGDAPFKTGVSLNADCLADVFGVKVFTDSPVPGVTEVVDVILAEFLLNRCSSSSSSSSFAHFDLKISSADLKKFLSYASSINAELTPEAQALISGYYLASRKRRSASLSYDNCANNEGAAIAAFPASAISTLTSLAVAHAKLRVNTEATEGDALAAILLFEENVTLQSGFSLFDVLPLPHLVGPDASEENILNGAFGKGAFDADSWLGNGNDAIMAHLAEKLNLVLEDVPPLQFGDEF